MTKLLLYLFEASILLIILYGIFRLLLADTDLFNFNRFYLIAIIVFSLLFPVISYDLTGPDLLDVSVSEISKVRKAYHHNLDNLYNQHFNDPEVEKSFLQQLWSQNWSSGHLIIVAVVLLYGLGFIFHLGRFLFACMRIYMLRKTLEIDYYGKLKIAKLPAGKAPFSFLNTIFIPDTIAEKRAYDQILAHEMTHIKQLHSIDLIFVQLLAAVLWFNPVARMLIKSLKQTHEYIADKYMLKKGFSLVEYQTLLLRQLISNNSYGLVHNFNLSFIKKRITMMSIKDSGWTGKSKAAIALFLIIVLGALSAHNNSNLKAQPLSDFDTAEVERTEIQFFVDGVSLNDGLEFAKIKDAKGELKFKLNNNKSDQIHIGLELMRGGQKVVHASNRFQEGTVFTIKEFLTYARIDDFIIVDIIDGPSDVVRLYKFPLFRESEYFQSHLGSDLPPPAVELFVNGNTVSKDQGIPLSSIKKAGANPALRYVVSGLVDFSVLERQAGDVTTSLVRDGRIVKSKITKGVKHEDDIPIAELIQRAKIGDGIMIQIGDPNGFQISSIFSFE